MELTNKDAIDWEKDIKMFAIWICPDLFVRVPSCEWEQN
jgi:hypothetical protein